MGDRGMGDTTDTQPGQVDLVRFQWEQLLACANAVQDYWLASLHSERTFFSVLMQQGMAGQAALPAMDRLLNDQREHFETYCSEMKGVFGRYGGMVRRVRGL